MSKRHKTSAAARGNTTEPFVMSSPAVSSSRALSASWGSIPALGNLESYIAAVHRLPMLTLEQERQLAQQLRSENDLEAAKKLVLSHLRVVVSVARQYAGYGLPQADLIQEGNVGLMKAVRRFDPTVGVRLVSYALHWIKAEIHEYIIRNWRMVKVATTKAQRKLFFNLRSMKQALLTNPDHLPRGDLVEDFTEELPHAQGSEEDNAEGGGLQRSAYLTRSLTPQHIDQIATALHVKPTEVVEMELRMGGGDIALDPTPAEGEDEAFGAASYLRDERFDPVQTLERRERSVLATTGVESALATLDARSRRIVTERWLKVNDDGSGGMTLHELAAEYGVSAERVRQIEVAALKKMRTSMTPSQP